MYRDDFQRLAPDYRVCALPVYKDNHFVEPPAVKTAMADALVEVHFELKHYVLDKDGAQQDSFSAYVVEIKILRDGEAAAASPSRKRNLRDGPLRTFTPADLPTHCESGPPTSSKRARTIDNPDGEDVAREKAADPAATADDTANAGIGAPVASGPGPVGPAQAVANANAARPRANKESVADAGAKDGSPEKESGGGRKGNDGGQKPTGVAKRTAIPGKRTRATRPAPALDPCDGGDGSDRRSSSQDTAATT